MTILDPGMGRTIEQPTDPITARPAVRRSRSIDSLTGIRGVAAVWVFLTHYQLVASAYLGSPAIAENSFMYNGFRGVDLFFVLSGFILMHVHGEEFRKLDAVAVQNFYVLRFFRVYPLNTAILLALVPLSLALPDLVAWFRFDHGVPVPYHSHDFSAAGFVQSLLLAQAWTVVKLGEWNGPAWSLSAEVFGYAMFPVLARFLMHRRSAVACVGFAVASLAILMGLLLVSGHSQDSPTGTFGLIRMLFGFIAGMSMARCFQIVQSAGRAARSLGEVGSSGGSVAMASLVFIALVLMKPATCMLVVFGFTGLIFGLAFQQGAVNSLLSSGPAMFFGRISFSLYMIHYIPLKMSLWLLQTRLADTGLPVRIACLVGIIGVCLVLAMITHACLEVPFQRLARSFMRKRSRATAGDVAPSRVIA